MLLQVREQLVLVTFAIHHMDHRAIAQLFLALLHSSCPALCFATRPASELAATKMLFATTSSRSFCAPIGLNVQNAQWPTVVLGVDNQSYVGKESRLAGRQVSDFTRVCVLESARRRDAGR